MVRKRVGKANSDVKEGAERVDDGDTDRSEHLEDASEHVPTSSGRAKQKDTKKGGGCCRCIGNSMITLVALLAVVLGLRQVQVDDVVRQQAEKWNITQWDFETGIGLPAFISSTGTDDAPRPGLAMAAAGLKPKHPVVIVPGFVTSGLELWKGGPCAKRYFRRRVWGTFTMTQAFLAEPTCWLEHMALNETTGLDVNEIKLRAAQGLDAVDYFVPGYHVWAKLIEALADVGYDTNNMISMPYDWRLSLNNMERRDNYFTRLKTTIELTHSVRGEKVMVTSHSWGDNVFRAFMFWVTKLDPDWVETHVAAYVNIAGPVLGVPKSISALLSGEMRDTVELSVLGSFVTENLIPRAARAKLFRTWGSLVGMLPQGGPKVWGNATFAPDDTPEMRAKNVTYGPMLSVMVVNDTVSGAVKSSGQDLMTSLSGILHTHKEEATASSLLEELHVDEALEALMTVAGENFRRRVWEERNLHVVDEVTGTEEIYDPFKHPLPHAPSLQMFCLYGIGKPAERGYNYIKMTSEKARQEGSETGVEDPVKEEGSNTHWRINTEMKEEASGTDIGVRSSDGDGSVPLISTGLLCRKHFRSEQLNPAGFRVITREFPHQPVAMYKDLRGGPKSSDHVDILGNQGVIEDILTVAAGQGSSLHDEIHSNIDEIAANVPLDVYE